MNKNVYVFLAAALILVAGGLYHRYRVNSADERGATQLMRLLEDSATNKRIPKRFLKHNKEINARDNAGQTALFYAVRHGVEKEGVRQLIAAGSDVQLTDNKDQTVLMEALRKEASMDVITELLRHGVPVNAQDNEGNTALLIASENGKAELVKVLLRAGADPDIANQAGKKAVDLIKKNKNFSADEKNLYHQAMLVISIIGPRPHKE